MSSAPSRCRKRLVDHSVARLSVSRREKGDNSLEHEEIDRRACPPGQNLGERGETVLAVIGPFLLAALLVAHGGLVAVGDDDEMGGGNVQVAWSRLQPNCSRLRWQC